MVGKKKVKKGIEVRPIWHPGFNNENETLYRNFFQEDLSAFLLKYVCRSQLCWSSADVLCSLTKSLYVPDCFGPSKYPKFYFCEKPPQICFVCRK